MTQRQKSLFSRQSRRVKYVAVAILLILWSFTFLSRSHVTIFLSTGNAGALKAAIVDQVALTYPDQSFVQTATERLNAMGYAVDYYSPTKVTVDFYSNLPAHGYQIIVLRVHTATEPPSVDFLTSEPYSSTKHVYEQLTHQLDRTSFHTRTDEFFAITPEFIRHSLKGTFQNTMIIMMGCSGAAYPVMAQVLMERGARVYVGWNSSVTADRTDSAVLEMLRLLASGAAVDEAVNKAMGLIGPDPLYKSQLIVYTENGQEPL